LRAEKLRRSRSTCEACGTKFAGIRGIDASRVLTVHHREQISAFDEPRTTSLDDLAVVCANCHMLIHADPKHAVPVEELAAKLKRLRWGR
jgi:5-methylcytosine-specific restriction enzyme A